MGLKKNEKKKLTIKELIEAGLENENFLKMVIHETATLKPVRIEEGNKKIWRGGSDFFPIRLRFSKKISISQIFPHGSDFSHLIIFSFKF